MSRKPLKIGGVMRCCIASLDDYEQTPDFIDDEGTVLPCKYCQSALIVAEGCWQWHRDYIPPAHDPPRAVETPEHHNPTLVPPSDL